MLPAPYRHFDGRDELLEAVAADGCATLCQHLGQVAAGASGPGERLPRLGGAYVRCAQEHPGLFVTMFRGPSEEVPVPAGTDSLRTRCPRGDLLLRRGQGSPGSSRPGTGRGSTVLSADLGGRPAPTAYSALF
ncbi:MULTISPECIES: TetR/AcrR family transcriptional regulator [unclassified Streptomyces]|uniref:TetR/AcrR family transcriptional regulator n=1 Tax=unclassified Streptomyces TaxID=2593676 RepID=UPI000697737C|nr:TetR/AcrR family transcriptional regulator [Streptomyces sp. NBRC 110035]